MSRYKLREVDIRIMPTKESSRQLGTLVERPAELEKEPANVIYVPSLEMLGKILTPKRIELLKCLAQNPGLSVNRLAAKLKRKQTAISRDLHYLEGDFIELAKEGRQVIPKTKYERIGIPLYA